MNESEKWWKNLINEGLVHFENLDETIDDFDEQEFDEAKLDFINSDNFNKINDPELLRAIYEFDDMETGGDEETMVARLAAHRKCPIDLLTHFSKIPWGSSSYDHEALHAALIRCGSLASLEALMNRSLPREEFVRVIDSEISNLKNRTLKDFFKTPVQFTLLWYLIHSPNSSESDRLKIEKAIRGVKDSQKYESFILELIN